MTAIGPYLSTLGGVAVLVTITVAVLAGYRVPHPTAPAWAILRGAVQLAAISLVLGGLITHPLGIAAALVVMFAVATTTATRRLGFSAHRFALVSGAMAAKIAVALGVVFGTHALALTGRYVLAIGGIVVGNAMTITTLAGRRFTEAAHDRWEEVEGWLALGATPRRSTLEIARGSVRSALIPSTDQTRTTGLVTLPGAFVGAIFGGVSPLEAGRFQIVVLAAIMAAGSITAVLVVRGLAPVTVRPDLPS